LFSDPELEDSIPSMSFGAVNSLPQLETIELDVEHPLLDVTFTNFSIFDALPTKRDLTNLGFPLPQEPKV